MIRLSQTGVLESIGTLLGPVWGGPGGVWGGSGGGLGALWWGLGGVLEGLGMVRGGREEVLDDLGAI